MEKPKNTLLCTHRKHKKRRTGQMAGTTLCVLYFGNLPPLEVMPMCGMVEKVQLAAILQAL